MYYATPAPPPVGDLGQEFESGLDLVLKKKPPLDHLTLEKKTNVEIIQPLHERDYLRRLVGEQPGLVALTRAAAREYALVRDGGGDTKCLRPDYASGSARPASWRRSRSRAAQRRRR